VVNVIDDASPASGDGFAETDRGADLNGQFDELCPATDTVKAIKANAIVGRDRVCMDADER